MAEKIAGCNISNIFIFSPWLLLNFCVLSYSICYRFAPFEKEFKFWASVFLGSLMTLLSLSSHLVLDYFLAFIADVIVKELFLIAYMASVIFVGLILINENRF